MKFDVITLDNEHKIINAYDIKALFPIKINDKYNIIVNTNDNDYYSYDYLSQKALVFNNINSCKLFIKELYKAILILQEKSMELKVLFADNGFKIWPETDRQKLINYCRNNTGKIGKIIIYVGVQDDKFEREDNPKSE